MIRRLFSIYRYFNKNQIIFTIRILIISSDDKQPKQMQTSALVNFKLEIQTLHQTIIRIIYTMMRLLYNICYRYANGK